MIKKRANIIIALTRDNRHDLEGKTQGFSVILFDEVARVYALEAQNTLASTVTTFQNSTNRQIRCIHINKFGIMRVMLCCFGYWMSEFPIALE